MHEELNDIHLLPCELVPDGGTGGVAVRPRAAVDQMDGAAFGRSLVVPVVVEAAVPAVQRSGQGGPLHLHVDPVAKRQHKRALLAQERGVSAEQQREGTYFLVITSCERQAGANMALNMKEDISQAVILSGYLIRGFSYGTSFSVFLSSMPRFWM